MVRYWLVSVLAGVVACAPASSQISPQRLRISAQDAAREARTVAVGWAQGAALRYVEGEGVTPEGYILPGRGAWRFVYEASNRADQLVVTVTPRTLEQATRPRQTPAGYVLGDAVLTGDWIDSPAALVAARDGGGATLLAGQEPAIYLLLVPLSPPQWVVRVAVGAESREWRVNARSGELLGNRE